jgi:hypothetical protein
MSKQQEEVLEGYEGYKVLCQDVRIYDSHVEIKLPNGMTKTISIADFLTTLSKTVSQEDLLKMTLLPANCYIWGQSITEMRLACYYPGKLREVKTTVSARGTSDYTIPFPNIVVSHILKRHLDGWEHQHARYYATTKSIGQLENRFIWEKNELDGVWALPLPNIYPEGRLCHGANTLLRGPFRESFRGLDWYFAVLHNSPFNDDLVIPSLAKALRTTGYFTELSKHKTFPYEMLVNGKKLMAAGRSVAQDIMDDHQAEFRPAPAIVPETLVAPRVAQNPPTWGPNTGMNTAVPPPPTFMPFITQPATYVTTLGGPAGNTGPGGDTGPGGGWAPGGGAGGGPAGGAGVNITRDMVNAVIQAGNTTVTEAMRTVIDHLGDQEWNGWGQVAEGTEENNEG